MNRREFMSATAFVAMSNLLIARADGRQDLRAAAREAWLYLLPLVEVSAVRNRALAAGPANTLIHQKQLTTVATQRVTSPNNDTLYSRAFLDLSKGPVTISLPPTGDRYLSVALMDMFTNNFAILGTRTTGRLGGEFTVVGPEDTVSSHVIRAPGPSAFMLARTLVDSNADVPAARSVQERISLRALESDRQFDATPSRDAEWRTYFTQAGRLLSLENPPVTDGALFERTARLGLNREGFVARHYTKTEEAEIEAGVAEAKAIARLAHGGTYTANGWSYPQSNLGWFKQDYAFRAQIALTGLFALPVEEAIYTRSMGDGSDGLFHGNSYRLHFPSGQLPPVEAFWSLTAYEATPAGQFFFTPNPIDRYSIGDRTEGLHFNGDGSLDIWISREDPGSNRRANWLPAPAAAPFMLSLRAYLPTKGFGRGGYHVPAIEHQ